MHTLEDITQLYSAILRPEQIVTGVRLDTRNSGYCAHSLDCGVVLLPESTEEVSTICRVANNHGVSIVPHGGLTGLVDGTATTLGQVAVSLERMAKIHCIDPDQRIAVVEAGVCLQDLIDAAAQHDLMPAFDIPSRGSARIGGLLSTNAGGVRVIRYGMARQNVLGIEAVLADGRRLNAMNRLQKNNAGIDLKQIFIGAEGTLGIITGAVISLVPRPSETRVALLAVERFDQAIDLLNAARSRFSGQLLSFELMWQSYYAHTSAQPGFGPRPLSADSPLYIIVEIGFWGGSIPVDCPLTDFLAQAFERDWLTDGVIAQSETQRTAIWRTREDGDSIESHFGACIDYDVGMEIGAMEHFVARLTQTCTETVMAHPPFIYGHMGDGNLHITFGLSKTERLNRAAFDAAVYGSLKELGPTTVSAEHGIGEEKRAMLPMSRDEIYLDVLRQMKLCLDPKNIMNPGKMLFPDNPQNR